MHDLEQPHAQPTDLAAFHASRFLRWAGYFNCTVPCHYYCQPNLLACSPKITHGFFTFGCLFPMYLQLLSWPNPMATCKTHQTLCTHWRAEVPSTIPHATRVKGLALHAKEREEETIKGRFGSLFKGLATSQERKEIKKEKGRVISEDKEL